MAFALKDVRYTVRRSSGGDAILYPRFLRDRSRAVRMVPTTSLAGLYQGRGVK